MPMHTTMPYLMIYWQYLQQKTSIFNDKMPNPYKPGFWMGIQWFFLQWNSSQKIIVVQLFKVGVIAIWIFLEIIFHFLIFSPLKSKKRHKCLNNKVYEYFYQGSKGIRQRRYIVVHPQLWYTKLPLLLVKVVEMFEHSTKWANQSNFSKFPKVANGSENVIIKHWGLV